MADRQRNAVSTLEGSANVIDEATLATEWAARSRFWLQASDEKEPRRRRQRETSPLVLTGHGLSVRVDKGCLLVRDGNTHYPAERREWRFFNGALDIPPALIVVDGSGEITIDAIDWLATQRVPLIRLRWDGEFSSIITTGGQAASADKVYWQERTRNDPVARLRFARDLIHDKALSTLATMEDHLPRSSAWENAYNNIAARSRLLEQRSPRSIEELLGIEGSIANEYFRAWSGVALKWKALKQRPIPDDWRTYKSRSALRDDSRGNYGATHPVNAMLNYAYGVLVARTQIELIAEGYDPTLGVLHGRESERGAYPAFALDRMEPMRPVVDRAVLQVVRDVTFTGSDFAIQPDGVCRLNPELARRVAQLTIDAIEASASLRRPAKSG
jgi:CRISP-associated protein Cas1